MGRVEIRQLRGRLGECWSLALLAALGLFYYGSYRLAFPFGFGDEGYLYYVADALGQGQLPYRDVRLFSYLPGLFYVWAPFLRWPGEEILIARTVMMLGLVLKPLLFYGCARRFTGPGLAFGAAFVVLLVPGPWHKFYVGVLGLWVFSALLAYAERPTIRRAVHLGAAAGAALVLRIDVGLLAAVLMAVTVLTSGRRDRAWTWRRRLIAPATAALAHLPILLFMSHHGLLGDYLRQWLGFAGLAARRASADLRLAPPSPESLLHLDRAAADAWVYFGALLVVTVYAAMTLSEAVSRARSSSGRWRTDHLLVGLWALGGLPQYALERPDVQHLTQYGVFFLLPTTVLADRLLRSLGDTWWQRPARLTMLLAATLFVTKHLAFAQGGSAGALSRPAHRVVLSNGFEYPAPEAEPLRPLLEIVIGQTTAADTIAALPFQPGVALATGRRLLGREVFLAPHSVTDPEVEAGYLRSLTEAPPRFVLYQPEMSFNGRQNGRLAAFAPAVDARLESAFRLRDKRQGYLLLEPRGAAGAPERSATRPPGASHKGSAPRSPR